MADVVETSSTGSFTIKQIEVKVSLRDGEFEGGGNTKIITDVPIHVKIEKTGPPDFCKATVEARGLKYEDMDRLTTLAFKPLKAAKNVVSIMVGNEVDGMSLAFQGEIESASADFNNAPNITLKLDCKAGYYGQTTPKGPTAIKGNQECKSFVAMLAKEMGYSFNDEGVTAKLSNSMFNGSPVQQARAAARQVGAELLIDDGVVTLTPSGGNGDTSRAVLLNKDSGMLKYPTITQDGIDVKALYNPEFKLGGYIRVESIVPGATGLWRIAKLSHDLQAFDPSGGPWESQISATEVMGDKSRGPEKGVPIVANSMGGNEGGAGGGGMSSGDVVPGDTLEERFENLTAEKRAKACAAAKASAYNVDDVIDCAIFCLPDITAAISERDSYPPDREGWMYLHNMFLTWLSGRANENENVSAPFLIDWQWVMRFERAYKAYEAFALKQTNIAQTFITSDSSMKKLGDILKARGMLGADFDFIDLPFDDLDAVRHAEVRVPVLPEDVKIDGSWAALAGFSFYAVASGKSERMTDKIHRITVNNVAVYARDNFKFHNTDSILTNYLGLWNCELLDGGFPDFNNLPSFGGYVSLYKKDFMNFRTRNGIGADFRVFSEPHAVENFSPKVYFYVQE